MNKQSGRMRGKATLLGDGGRGGKLTQGGGDPPSPVRLPYIPLHPPGMPPHRSYHLPLFSPHHTKLPSPSPPPSSPPGWTARSTVRCTHQVLTEGPFPSPPPAVPSRLDSTGHLSGEHSPEAPSPYPSLHPAPPSPQAGRPRSPLVPPASPSHCWSWPWTRTTSSPST